LRVVICVALLALLACITLHTSSAYAATKKQKVTITVNMKKNGSTCPELRFKRSGKKTIYSQVVSKWYIDGKLVKDPWSRFFKKGWKFSKHNIKVVMPAKLASGTYKVSLDNGKKVKTLGSIKVKKAALKRSYVF